MAWVRRAGGSGGGAYGPGNLGAQTGIPVLEPPAFTDPGQVTRPRNRAEPYVRARLPEHGSVDAKVAGVSPTHVLLHWETDFGAQVHNAWAPAGWLTRIGREESTGRDPYDKPED